MDKVADLRAQRAARATLIIFRSGEIRLFHARFQASSLSVNELFFRRRFLHVSFHCGRFDSALPRLDFKELTQCDERSDDDRTSHVGMGAKRHEQERISVQNLTQSLQCDYARAIPPIFLVPAAVCRKELCSPFRLAPRPLALRAVKIGNKTRGSRRTVGALCL